MNDFIIVTVLPVVGIGLSVWIAYWQKRQLTQIELISRGTSDTARKLETDSYKKKIVNRLFALGDGSREASREEYDCIFPVYHDDTRPLPLIVSGDYHALSVLQNLIGNDRLRLRPISHNTQNVATGAPSDSARSNPADEPARNTIFLCTPVANRELNRLAPAVDLSTACAIPTFGEDQELPCWFATEEINGHQYKRILVAATKERLSSHADEEYDSARTAKSGDPYVSTGKQTDLAILMRILHLERQIVVLAGIHQYGTWVAGDFLQRLASDDDVPNRDVFESNDDFLCVLWGRFDSDRLRVDASGIHHDLLWHRPGSGEKWRQIQA